MSKDPILTTADLESWLASGRPPDDSPPARLAVLGDPVAHSRSPAMHQPALDERGLGMRYVRLHVKPGGVAAAFRAMRALGFTGCNVTVPHKSEAMENCDVVAPAARLFQAVNTVTFAPDGTTSGTNTDGPGLAAAILECFHAPLSGFHVAILGAGGGAGRAAALQCALDGCPDIVLANRTVDKAVAVAAEISRIAPATRTTTVALDDLPAMESALAGCTLLVNATSLGMKPADPLPCPAALLRPGLAVFDMIYSPAETGLLAAARAAGAPASNGLPMLIHQGALSFVHWFGPPAPVETMRRALG